MLLIVAVLGWQGITLHGKAPWEPAIYQSAVTVVMIAVDWIAVSFMNYTATTPVEGFRQRMPVWPSL